MLTIKMNIVVIMFISILIQCSGSKSTDKSSVKIDTKQIVDSNKLPKQEIDPKAPMKLKKIHKNIYMARGVNGLASPENRGFMSNSYGILTSEGWFVVDALATPALAKEFIGELNKIKKAPVKYVVITHYHMDHWYGAQSYKENGTTVIAHENVKKFTENPESELALKIQKERFKVFDDVKLTPPTMPINKKTIIKMGKKNFQIEPFTPAHTNTDLIVYLPDNKYIFVGDLIGKDRIPFAGDRTSTSSGWIKFLEKMKTYPIDKIFSGHNKPMKATGIDFNLNYIKYLRENIKKLKDQNKSYDEVKKALEKTPFHKSDARQEFHYSNIYKIYNDLDIEILSEGK